MDFDLSKIEGFDWNKGNLEHIKKHNVDYKECEQVFFNKPIIVNDDKTHSQKEQRFRIYGRTNKNRRLMVIYIIRENKIRVISSRDQSRQERKEFQKTEVSIYEKT